MAFVSEVAKKFFRHEGEVYRMRVRLTRYNGSLAGGDLRITKALVNRLLNSEYMSLWYECRLVRSLSVSAYVDWKDQNIIMLTLLNVRV